VKKLVAIEGVGLPIARRYTDRPAADRLREWMEKCRAAETRTSHSYPDLASAVARMREANPFLTEEVAQHLTLHGTNWNADGSLIWKFDNYARIAPPYGMSMEEGVAVLSTIACPSLLFWGRQSFASDPENDPQAAAIKDHKIVKVDQAGHWLHHDQLAIFLAETKKFLHED